MLGKLIVGIGAALAPLLVVSTAQAATGPYDRGSGAGYASQAGGGGAARVVWGAAPAAVSWGRAIEVPGLAALGNGSGQGPGSVSCATAGSCAAAGTYTNSHQRYRVWVAAERDGRWHKAIPVPGLAALNKGGFAAVWSVSCGSPGSCTAGGEYAYRRGHYRGFVTQAR
jgi:hypothetical protein